MSLQAILDAIKVQSENRIRQIEEDTHQQTELILQRARVDGEAERDRIVAAHGKRGEQAKAQRLQAAHYHSARALAKTREELVSSAIELVENRLQTVRENPNYSDILNCLTEEALAALRPSLSPGEVPVLQVDPRDQAQLNTFSEEVCLEYSLDCNGGVVAKSEDGKVVVINTLEERFLRAKPYLRQLLDRILYSG